MWKWFHNLGFHFNLFHIIAFWLFAEVKANNISKTKTKMAKMGKNEDPILSHQNISYTDYKQVQFIVFTSGIS